MTPTKALAAALAASLAGSLAAGCSAQRLDSFLYDPLRAPPRHYDVSTAVIPAYEDVFVTSADGVKIHVAFIPASSAAGAHPDVTMLYFHGQSNDVGTTWPRLELLYPLGVNLAAVDPRGYGMSGGEPSEPGIHGDLQAVWDQLPVMKGLDPTKLVIYGRSLGAAFAIDLAAARTPAALITESAFASVEALVRDGAYVDLPVGFVADSRWDNLAKIPRVAAPYLALHGLADDYVKYQYSQQLTAAHTAGQPGQPTQLELVAGADHGDAHGPPPTLNARVPSSYVELLRTFLGL
jgi:pimeloyl-ACP methyl ester carboxylesterase